MIRILTLVVLLGAAPVWADVPARVEAAFDLWMKQVGASNGVLIAQYDGAPQITVARGWRKDQEVVLASLSKSITAICAASLMREGVLDPDATSAEILGYGREGISVASLLTHGSGLVPDQTQSVMSLWLDTKGSRAGQAAERALKRKSQTGTVGTYRYNNENYAVVGEIIAKVSGAPYQEACAARVFEPAGVTGARVSPRVGSTLPWGGWEMSVGDFAKLMEWAYGPQGIIGKGAMNWPVQPVNSKISYGMGMFQRSNGPGYNFWHFGAFCFPLRMNVGAYAVRWGNGWSVVAAYDACLTGDQMGGLDRAMIGAVFQ